MDTIWYRNPSKSEVIGRGGGDEKTEWPRRTDKSPTLKIEKSPSAKTSYLKTGDMQMLQLFSRRVHTRIQTSVAHQYVL